ncbi:IS4 family transposase, partial [Calidithermus terrae]
HQGRKGDGMPGWLTLWRGMARLQTLVEGVRLARKIKTYG